MENMKTFPGQIADLNAHGADFDVVGSQMHLFNPAESVDIAAGKGPAHLRPEAVFETFAPAVSPDVEGDGRQGICETRGGQMI